MAVQVELRVASTTKDSTPSTPLQELYRDLAAAIEDKKKLGFVVDNSLPDESFKRLDAKVRTLITEYINNGAEDWKSYCFFNPHHYVRNLVAANEDFELLVVCWDKDQVSRIHDHQRAHGWVTVLDGAVQEKRFQVPGGRLERKNSLPISPPLELPGVVAALTPCPQLEEFACTVAGRGDGTLHITDHIALHSVGCAPAAQRAVTLHLYAPPIRRVQLFEPEVNRVVERTPGYYSVGGKRV